MRTFLTVVLSLLGGLLLLIGGAAALLVGPDDTASLPTGEVPARSGVALTSYDLFPVRDLTLHVTATSEGGPVFLGVAHPVDARDYVTGVEASWVTGVDRSGALTAEGIAGELQAPEVDPTTATFWQRSVSGTGARALDVTLGEEPVSIVVAPLGGPAATAVSFGVVVPHLFVGALGAAGAGALLVTTAVLVRRRGRRDTGTSASAAPLAGAPPVDPPAVDQAAGRTPARGVAAPRAVQSRTVVLGLGVTLALGACSALPSAVEHPGPPARIAADDDELAAALTSYGERRTAASATAAQLDGNGWAASDTDGLLALLQFRTTVAAAHAEPPAAATMAYEAIDTAVPTFTSYPMWFMAVLEQTTDGEVGEVPQVRVFERERATAPWRASLALDLPADAVDLPGPGTASVATPAQVTAGLAGLDLVRSHLESGTPTAVQLGELEGVRADILGNDLDGKLVVEHAQVRLLGSPPDPAAAGGPVQVVPVDGGVLVTATLDFDFTQHMAPGWTVSLTDPTFAEVVGQTGERQNLRKAGLVQAALLVPDGAPPRVLAAGWTFLVPRA